MFSGVKFIPRDQLLSSLDKSHSGSDKSEGERKYSTHAKKSKTKKNSNQGGSAISSKDDKIVLRRKQKKSKNKKSKIIKKWYSSDDCSEESTDSENYSSDSKNVGSFRRKRRSQELSDEYSSSSDEYDKKRDKKMKHDKKKAKRDTKENDYDDLNLSYEQNTKELARKELGLDWMLRPAQTIDKNTSEPVEGENEEHKSMEMQKPNPKELNPYLKDNGTGYPDETSGLEASDKILPSSVIGDGGASWRLKAFKRAKEQAAREGRKLDEVVEERWGSLGQLTESLATFRAAHGHAHLHAIKDRRRGQNEFSEVIPSDETNRGIQEVHSVRRDYLRDVSSRNLEMKKPRQDLSWKSSKGRRMSSEDKSLISAAIADLNKFTNDGSFLSSMAQYQSKDAGVSNSFSVASLKAKDHVENKFQSPKTDEEYLTQKQVLSSNQMAAKILQLRMKGKHDEADQLSKEMEACVKKEGAGQVPTRMETEGITSRYVRKQMSREHSRREDDADAHLAKTIMQNKQYSMGEDDEYGYDVAPRRKHNKKKEEVPDRINISKRFLTQQERCQFCFENPSRPKHLVISIANFTYLMLPQLQPVVEGHCCILPMQHEASTRSVDKNVWEEIRNFKKCLIRMFASHEKDVIFLETVVGLEKQRRHCLLDCIPIPYEVREKAPMYFRKAIEEAEEEWGQHDMKKVIPTSGNLQHVIPENFSYFHVEFGLQKGFVHVIDKDSNFNSGFGLNVVRGLLRVPEEDMYRRRRHETVEKQKQAVTVFAQQWERFDWTRDLD